jgi:uncharacterized membrane protein YgcG
MVEYSTTSVVEIKAGFPITKIDPPIVGRPNLGELLRVLKQLARCARSLNTGKGSFGFLFLVLKPAAYAVYAGTEPYPVIDPPDHDGPDFPIEANEGERVAARIEWQREKMEYENQRNMNSALTSMFLQAIEEAYKKKIEYDMIGFPNGTFLDFFDTFVNTYGRVTPHDIEKNNQAMLTPWNPADHIGALIRQINDAAEFAALANHPKTDLEKVTAGELLVLKASGYESAYEKWRALPENERGWTRFMSHFKAAWDLKQETETTAGNMGYGMNATADEAAGDDIQAQYDMSVSNFSGAYAAQQAAMHNLTETNSSLGTGVRNEVGQLRNDVAAINQQLCQVINNMSQQQQQPHPMQYMAPPHMQYMAPTYQAPPAAQQQQQQPYQQPYQQTNQQSNNYNNRQGGRGGGRGGGGRGGGGRGGGGRSNRRYDGNNNNGNNNSNGNYNMNNGGYYGNGGGYYANRQTNPPNPVKYYNNWNYCWTHGHDLPDNHCSANCRNPTDGHMWNATRTNTMGGRDKNKHKTQLPQQNNQNGGYGNQPPQNQYGGYQQQQHGGNNGGCF